MSEKELLRKLGEETIYSAKGHFKAADIRRNLFTLTIWSCALLNVISLIGVTPNVDRYLSAIGLIGMIALLIWNEGDGKEYRSQHKRAAETYLALHKEVRACYFLSDCTREHVQQLSDKISSFDMTNKPDIPWTARKWAQLAIEKYDETSNWFLKA